MYAYNKEFMSKEAMNLKDSREGLCEGIVGGRRKGELLWLN